VPHPLVTQLRFTRSEFMRAIRGVSEEDAVKRLEPMNCISWNVGHLAWQEQRYFLRYGQDTLPFPDINREFAVGAPASTPPLERVVSAWHEISSAADAWLESLSSADLQRHVVRDGKEIDRVYGNLLQRTIYHYWYHTGETMAIRQQLGHTRLPQFVGNIDEKAPYRPDDAHSG
jgi:hypothetical protein